MPESPAPLSPALSSLPSDHPAQVFAALSARELVALVQQASTRIGQPETQVVFTAFYHRYYAYLMTVVSNRLTMVRDDHALREIVHDVLVAFFRKVSAFDLSRAADDDGLDRLVRSYLARLARWKSDDARSFQAGFARDTIDPTEWERHVAVASDAEEGEATTLQQAVAEWLSGLRPVEDDVHRAYYLDDQAGRKSERLPGGVAAELAERHGLTTSAIRHIKLKLLREARERFARYLS